MRDPDTSRLPSYLAAVQELFRAIQEAGDSPLMRALSASPMAWIGNPGPLVPGASIMRTLMVTDPDREQQREEERMRQQSMPATPFTEALPRGRKR
jgi:hypothetical protein